MTLVTGKLGLRRNTSQCNLAQSQYTGLLQDGLVFFRKHTQEVKGGDAVFAKKFLTGANL